MAHTIHHAIAQLADKSTMNSGGRLGKDSHQFSRVDEGVIAKKREYLWLR